MTLTEAAMARPGGTSFRVAPACQPMLREIGLDADAVFDHSDVRVWRSIPERENCTLDATLSDGRAVRLHIKRYRAAGDTATLVESEVRGIQLLEAAGIGTVPLVGWGHLADGRGFVITLDLAGYAQADRLVAAGLPFERISGRVASITATLHESGLHHRDLYLCHWFVRESDVDDIRLIDAARVRPLPRWLFRERWIVKDLAQLWYSTLALPVSDDERSAWLERYARARKIANVSRLRRQIERKSAAIARHDARLNAKQPNRNISIPQPGSRSA